jgi:hypothetical protein
MRAVPDSGLTRGEGLGCRCRTSAGRKPRGQAYSLRDSARFRVMGPPHMGALAPRASGGGALGVAVEA